MDEKELKKILQDVPVPPADENAKKRALNLAMTEFEAVQKEKQKSLQGNSFLRRLMGSLIPNKRRRPMSETMKYSGMAIAATVLLIAGITVLMPQLNQYKSRAPSDMVASSGGKQARQEPRKNKEMELPAVTGKSERYSSSEVPQSKAAIPSKEKNKRLHSPLAEPKRILGGKMDAPAELDKMAAISQPAPAKALASLKVIKEKSRVINEQAAQGVIMSEETIESFDYALNESFGSGDSMSADSGYFADYSGSAADLTRGSRISGLTSQPSIAPSSSVTMKFSSKIVGDSISPDTYKDVGRDQFEKFEVNAIHLVSQEPVSTFSIDVDTASYSFMRREIMRGVLPQRNAVRVEEMINYFHYDYPLPDTKDRPFRTSVAVVPSPWKEGNKLIHIGIKGYEIDKSASQPRSNLVFLLDVSGSMNSPDKLPLMVNSLKLLLNSLQPEDTVGIVVYAGAAGTALEPTAVKEKGKILAALNRLSAGGSTAGGQGIRLAYQMAEANFDKEAVNRVILATDGDFNVGITDREELKGFIERKRKTGVFLSVFGFGQGNYNDSLMQALAQNGNGVAAYIDTLSEARKILVDEATSTLFPIAKDVKIQVEFNPATVAEYRLIGYETRSLKREDFNNDAVDAGDIGAGHTVTAIYEITPVGGPLSVDASRYQKAEPKKPESDFANEYAFLKIRYKLPDQDTSTLVTAPITAGNRDISPIMTQETKWAASVAGFGQLLKGGKYTGGLTYDDVIKQAQSAKGKDEFGYRSEFIQLVRLAKSAAALQR